MIEEWKPIVGFEDKYEISNHGSIKSLNYHNTSNERILSPFQNYNGYLFINLYKHNKRKKFYVHRLVAMAFIPNPNNLPQINHKDEDKQNNHVSNLEWCDSKYNVNYGSRTERATISNYNRKNVA